MNDSSIIELFFRRSEEALRQTNIKYGRYCHGVARNILGNDHDAEECVNDTYLKAWNSIPPSRPDNLKLYLAKIVRNTALDLYDRLHADKRVESQYSEALDELSSFLPDTSDGDFTEGVALSDLLSRFLRTLPESTRNVFIRRYWYMESPKEVARFYDMTESHVNVILHRTRELLKKYLESEGISV